MITLYMYNHLLISTPKNNDNSLILFNNSPCSNFHNCFKNIFLELMCLNQDPKESNTVFGY